jgi:hypothetical protein
MALALIRIAGPPCVFHLLTGLYCPGCGGTRAILALLAGNVGLAFRENVLLMGVAIPAFALLGLAKIYPSNSLLRRCSTAALRIAAYLTVAFFVVRNLPFHFLDVLRPT